MNSVNIKSLSFFLISIIFLFACQNKKLKILPHFGIKEIFDENENKFKKELIKINNFRFIDQDSNIITSKIIYGKVYIVDFFFTSCPTICPKMTQQMLRVYNEYIDDTNVIILSHSIDIRNDTVPKLKSFANKLKINTDKWHILTGESDSIYHSAKNYMLALQEDKKAIGGYLHSGQFVLMDQFQHIRGYYNGTEEKDVDNLIQDIKILLQEKHE